MTKSDTSTWAGCPVRYAAGIFGDHWTMLILRDVLFHGRRHYGDFLAAGEGISTNILAKRLASLEARGMLTRHVDAANRSKVFYLPTEKTKALLPAFLEMMVWSVAHDEDTEAPSSFAQSWRDDPKATLAWYHDEIARVDRALAD